jgi:hypothetical protein
MLNKIRINLKIMRTIYNVNIPNIKEDVAQPMFTIFYDYESDIMKLSLNIYSSISFSRIDMKLANIKIYINIFKMFSSKNLKGLAINVNSSDRENITIKS